MWYWLHAGTFWLVSRRAGSILEGSVGGLVEVETEGVGPSGYRAMLGSI